MHCAEAMDVTALSTSPYCRAIRAAIDCISLLAESEMARPKQWQRRTRWLSGNVIARADHARADAPSRRIAARKQCCAIVDVLDAPISNL